MSKVPGTISGIRFVDWMVQHEDYQKRNGVSKSFRTNILAAKKYVEPYNSEILLKYVDGVFIVFLKKQKYTKRESTYPLAHNTTCCRIRNLHSALNYAVRKKMIAYNPCLDAETRVDEQECKKSYLTVKEVKHLITPVRDKRVFVLE